MKADRLLFLLVLCFKCVSSNDGYFEESLSEFCETLTFRAPLGSSVLLPCNFSTSSNNSVLWSQIHGVDMVNLTSDGQIHGVDVVNLKSDGRIRFLDHRYGRVKAFPNQGSERNYSICIDELKSSDLGCYRCSQDQHCLQVELVVETGEQRKEMMLLIYICVGVAACVLLCVGGYCCMKCIMCYNRNNPAGAGTEGASALPEETGQQRGAENLVYENDDQDPANPTRNHCGLQGVLPDPNRTQPTQTMYPTLNQFNCEMVESPRNRQRFHSELFGGLRQTNITAQFYANQDEIRKQHAMSAQGENPQGAGRAKKKAKDNCEYKNPIYNRSMDQLNRL